ncbi:MAG: mechanosensitive ion channel [Acidilobaceae archaeon]
MTREEAKTRTRNELIKALIYIILYIVTGAIITVILGIIRSVFNVDLTGLSPYVNAALLIIFGYFVIKAISNAAFYTTYSSHEDLATAAAVKNAVFLIGLGALIVAIVGAVVSGATAVALAGFLAIVIGYATQQVLSQVLAGFFLILIRPFKLVTDRVNVVGEEGYIEEVGVIYTKMNKDDKTVVLIPNTSLIGNKIYILTEKVKTESRS